MSGKAFRAPGYLCPAFVGQQRHVVATRLQLLRQGKGRREMPTGSAGGQYVVARNASHFVSFPRLGVTQSKPSRDRYGLRRVNANSSPSVRATAIVDEPP